MLCEKHYSVVLLIGIFQLFPFLLNAQDAHYWHSAYSPGALLTPGATIVNDKDSGYAQQPKNPNSNFLLYLYNCTKGS
jgi:hypothetical protein